MKVSWKDYIEDVDNLIQEHQNLSPTFLADRLREIKDISASRDAARHGIKSLIDNNDVTTEIMQTTRIKKGANGQVLSTVESRRKIEKAPYNPNEGVITHRTINPYGPDWVKVRYDQIEPEEIEDRFEAILDRYINGRVKRFNEKVVKTEKALITTITDEHVGMDVTDKSLFQYTYGPTEYKQSMKKVFQAIMKEYKTHGTFDILYIDGLGDGQDGWNGYTTRGGHDLPQNMTNGEVFEVCLDSKLQLIESLIDQNVANKIIVRIVTNDNHSGSFGEVIARALKKFINRLYDTEIVDVDILSKFIEHRVYGDHCHLLTHGKDEKQMKSGLPYNLNDKTINYINSYIDHYGIDSKYIHLHKGDLHCVGLDSRPVRFDYYNFGSFAPPSNWIQTNFGPSRSSFATQVIPKSNNEVSWTPYYLNYKKAL